jgi:D-3-phosphoglycerate dehydrogenase
LDVFATEPVTDSPLVKHPKVVCTPHVAAQTAEAQERAARDIAEEILTVLRGQPPRWRVA